MDGEDIYAWLLVMVGSIYPLYYVIYVLQVRVIASGLESRRARKQVDYWTQQEIDQTMAWWDREFNRLSGTGEFAAVAQYKAGKIETRASCPSCGGKAVSGSNPTVFTCTSCGMWHLKGTKKPFPNGGEPVYGWNGQMVEGDYVLDVIPPTTAEVREDQAYELPAPIAVPYKASRNIYAMTQESGRR